MLEQKDFELFQKLLKEKSGLVINESKNYLLESRLNPIAKEWGLDDINGLVQKMRSFPDPKLVQAVVEAMTTNETMFFRDNNPFDRFIETVLPVLAKRRDGAKKIRIWSCACSSGQEPYTLAMLLKENAAKMPGWNFEIIGTDISSEIVAQARKGEFSQFEVQRGLPINLLMKYFQQDNERWLIKDDIKRMVQFKEFNLLDNMMSMGQFDVIFCRNVLIYFDEETKSNIMDRLAKQMPNDGFLFLGAAETVLGLSDSFKVPPGVRGTYIRKDSPEDYLTLSQN